MAEKIRGITIELGGDASGLEQSLKGVNEKIKDTQDQLKDVERLLKLDPKNTELLAQKQKLLGDQIANTNKKLKDLKQAQETMDKNGVDKNSAQYMALSREIQDTERNIKNLEKASEETSRAMSSIGDAAEKVAAGANAVAEKTRGLSTAAAGALAAIGGLAIKSAQTADELNTLSKQTGFSTDELQKFQYASDLVDVSMEDITGAASKLKKAVASDSEELEKLGVKTRNANGTMRDISDVFYDTLNALGRIKNETERDAAAMAIFGKSADSLAGIVDDGGRALKEYGKEAEDLGLILDEKTLTSLNKANDEFDRLKGQARARLAETGAKALQALMPVLQRVLTLIEGVLKDISNLSPAQMETIMLILSMIAVLSPLASAIGKVSSLLASLPTLISSIGTAITTLISNPYALLIIAIIALVALIALNFDKIKDAFEKFGEKVKQFAASVKSAFSNIGKSIKTKLVEPFKNALSRFGDWLNSNFAKPIQKTFTQTIPSAFKNSVNAIKGIWESSKTIFNNLLNFIQGPFTQRWRQVWNGVKNALSNIARGIMEVFKQPLNGIISMINKLIDGINWMIRQINVINKAVGISSIGEIGHIPMLASGGIISKGTAIVGEAGPELVTVSNGKAVVQPLTNGGSGATVSKPIVITVNSILDGRIIGKNTTVYQERTAKARG